MNRSGAVSLPELLLTTSLYALVLAGLARFAADQARLVATQRDRVRMEEAARTAATVLAGELRFLAPADLAAAAPDSLRVRAFRGGGAVCDAHDNSIWVWYRGIRLPEPAKDSAVLIGPGPTGQTALAGVQRSERCGGSYRLDLTDRSADPRYALIFEVGSYGLSDGALRYRRGAGGRQPLTEAILRRPAFHIDPRSIQVRIGPDPDSLPRIQGSSIRVRIPRRNLDDES